MGFIKVGVKAFIRDAEGRILLSRREDIGRWNLPGGRLDSGEPVATAAAREVREETGVEVEIERTVGLFYWERRGSLVVCFAGKPNGGELVRHTDETVDNRFFPPDALPDDLLDPHVVRAGLAAAPPQAIFVPLSWGRVQLVRAFLAARWVRNLLQGRPEPRRVPFRLSAKVLLHDAERTAILSVPGGESRALPRITCRSEMPPWESLRSELSRHLPGAEIPRLDWVGLWQDTGDDVLEFVFNGVCSKTQITPTAGAAWTPIQGESWRARDAAAIARNESVADGTLWIANGGFDVS